MVKLPNGMYIDRIIKTLKSLIKDTSNLNNRQLEVFIDKVINILIGALSSIFSACVVSIIKNENIIPQNVIVYLVIFLALSLIIWGVFIKWVVPFFYRCFPQKHPLDITAVDVDKKIEHFNNEIIYQASAMYDLIKSADVSKDIMDKKFGMISSLFILQEIVDFLYSCFVENHFDIRKDENAISYSFLRCSFNAYSVVWVLEIIDCTKIIMESMLKKLLEENASGYKFLETDLSQVLNDFDQVKKILNQQYDLVVSNNLC